MKTLACLCAFGVVLAVQQTVWDGVYSEAQAKRGQTSYMQICAQCHSEDLQGGGNGPALTGEDFQSHWRGKSVGDLVDQMQTAMPPDRPASLPGATYRDIAAFVLKSNDFPAGEKELAPAIPELRRIMITRKL